jgi:RNA polymerase sigma-70 factor, ECF subfamily
MRTSDFREVFDEYAPFVWRAMRRLRVPPSDLDDACQEVFMVLYRRLSEFEGRSALRTWVYGICVRVALACRRKRGPQLAELSHRTDHGDLGDVAVETTIGEELDRNRALAELDRALDRLDDDKRAVFVLYELEDLPMPEVAAAVACPLQTAYSRLHAARRQIASHFSHHLREVSVR